MFTTIAIIAFIAFILYNIGTAPTPTNISNEVTKNEFQEYMYELRNNKQEYIYTEPKDMIDYQTYIKSSKWKENQARKNVLHSDHYQCRMCGNSDTIEVHHITYKNLGNEHTEDLTTLCRDCHEYTHKMAGKGASYYPPIKAPNV